MAAQYKNEIIKVSVAQICQSIGFQGICSTPLDVLSDLLHRYMTEVCRLTHRYTEHFGRTDPNLDDLSLAFHDMGISVAELEEYVNNVDCPPFTKLPSIPVPRASNLNFLKPGAREILSRPIHIHEHLPPMYPEKEEEELEMKVNTSFDDVLGETSSPLASPQGGNKRSSDGETSPSKKQKYSMDDEGQPVREIESVMMTTSGFISSAREGKLPEARVPNIPMAAPRSSSPSSATAAGKKKLTVEKLIRQKNSQVGSSKPAASKPKPIKDKSNSKPNNKPMKALKLPKMPKMPKIPKLSQTGPGSNAPPPVSQATPGTPLAPPKLKMPPPKIKVPKPSKSPKSETKKTSTPKSKDSGKENDAKKVDTKKVKKEKEPGKKTKEGKKEKDSTKKPKESKKEKESKREKEPKKEKESKKEKENKKEKERERERELIRALAASSAVTVTSIPPPSKSQDNNILPSPEKAEGKSKLSIFKKINKPKADPKDQDRQGERDNLQSRDSSPDLMIDETTTALAHRRPPPPPPPPPPEDFSMLDNPVRRLEPQLDNLARSPRDFPSYPDDLSPPGTPPAPRTPEIPNLPVRKAPEKRKNKEKAKEKKPRKDRSKVSKCSFNPGPREHPVSESETPERPKTPEVGIPLEDLGGPPVTPFNLLPFPNVPSFIPPFNAFPYMHPFGGPPQRPGLPNPPMPDIRLSPHFIPRPTKRCLEDEHMAFYDSENLERPLTPRHDRDSSPLPPQVHSSPMRSPSPTPLLETPPRPRTPAHHSPPPMPKAKPEKPEKEKKKEHKKEKKEKEKTRKKKDKKDKSKEPDKKKKEKLDKKKEKKVKKSKDESVATPHITMKLPPAAPSPPKPPAPPPPQEVTPKLVIKPVVKHAEEPPVTKSSTPSSGGRDDQPGSPEIAKFSALITRPPRNQQKKGDSSPIVPILKIKEVHSTKKESSKESSQPQSKNKDAKEKEVPPLKIKNVTASIKVPSTPKAADEKKSAGNKKSREKKEKKEKVSKDTSKSSPAVASMAMPSSSRVDPPATPQPPPAPPVVHPPPPDPPKPKKQEQQSSGLLTETVGPIGHFVDDQGNEVWICPTCGKQDDGSPMIGCDTCDDWYHWVCVGIQVPPNEEVNWYCPRCVSQHKQRGAPPEKKKRGRKKK